MRQCVEHDKALRGWASRCAILLLSMGVAQSTMAQNDQPPLGGEGIEIQALETGEYVCKTEAYEALIGPDGNLRALSSDGTPFLAQAAGNGPAAGLIHDGQFVSLTTLKLTASDTLVAE